MNIYSNDDDWKEQALCAQVDPELFYPEEGGSGREAKFICSRCPVRAECLEASIDEVHGYWAGTSPTERKLMRRDAA